MTLILVTPPAAEPVTLDDAKAFLKVEHDGEDTLIETLIAAARLHVEATVRRVLIHQGWRLVLDGWPPRRVVDIPLAPVAALDAVTVYDDDGTPETLDAADYVADTVSNPARLIVRRNVAVGSAFNGVEIDFTAGYGATAGEVPAPLRQAMLMLVAHWHELRQPVSFGGGPNAVPHGVEALVAPYRVLGL